MEIEGGTERRREMEREREGEGEGEKERGREKDSHQSIQVHTCSLHIFLIKNLPTTIKALFPPSMNVSEAGRYLVSPSRFLYVCASESSWRCTARLIRDDF